MENVQHIWFSGQVQRVGFRKTSAALARMQGLRGWVRNLLDGRVEMQVAGPEDQIEILLDALQERFQITGMEVQRDTVASLPAAFEQWETV